MPYKRIIRWFFQNKLKPSFYRKPTENLISASQAWQQISSDFKGPVKGKNNYLLIAIDEYSRFPFVFPCCNMTRQTVINCLRHYFVYTDCGSCFSAKVFKGSLHFWGIVTSRKTPYQPTGNLQNERWNQTIWRTIKLILHGRRLPEEAWANVLQDALHSTLSLLCASTNSNPQFSDKLQNVAEEINQIDKMLSQPTTPNPRHELRRSTQIRKAPICYGNSVLH